MKKKGLITWILEFAGRKAHFFGVSVILAMLGVACSFVPYLIVANIVETLISGNATWEGCLPNLVLIGVFWLVRITLHSVSTSLSHIGTFNVLSTIRKQLAKKLITIPLGAVLDDNSGSYKNIIVERVDSMETTLAHIVPEFTANLLLPLVMFVTLIVIDWRLGLANIIGAVIGCVFVTIMMIKSKGEFEVTVQKTKKLNDTAVEYINGIEVIKAFGKSKVSYDKFVTAAQEGADCFINWMRKCIWQQAGAFAFLPATFLGVLPIGLLLVRSGGLSEKDFITSIILSASLITPLVVAFSYMDDIRKMQTIFGEVTEILERPDMVRPKTLKSKPQSHDIELKDVRFSYKEKEILHGVNLKINQGEMTAIVGPSGSGKTTIVRLIDSLYDVDSGSIVFGGADIKTIPLDYYMQQIAYVSQDNYLFDLSVMENIRLGKLDATDEEVIMAAKQTGCHDAIMMLEKGYETIVGNQGKHISGGERQRICIARAMLKDAPVIILDEATAYTDPENEALVQSSVAKLVKEKTLIVIAHRLSTIVDADKIVVINDGNVEATGKHEELLTSCELYKKMWKAHISAKDNTLEEYNA